MKKLTFILLVVLASKTFSQNDNSWRIGVHWGFQSSKAKPVGGMPVANARFGNEDAGGGALGIQLRYDFNKHWMFSSGVGFQSFGFKYTLSQNYTLLNPESRLQGVSTEFGALEIPMMWHYKFNPNCKNSKWVVGAGWIQGLIGKKTVNKTYTEGTEGNLNANTLTCNMNTSEGLYYMVRFSVGKEKVFKRGNILGVNLLFNASLRNLATAKVNYSVDGQNYNHEFENRGNFVGLRINYFFRPLPSKDLRN